MTSPTKTAPVASQSMATSSRTRTSSSATPAPASSQWPMPAQTPMARSSSSAPRKRHGWTARFVDYSLSTQKISLTHFSTLSLAPLSRAWTSSRRSNRLAHRAARRARRLWLPIVANCRTPTHVPTTIRQMVSTCSAMNKCN